MELQAELTVRDGSKRAWRVRCEPPGELRGLLAGLSRLREEVTARLGPLVQQESVAAAGDRDEGGGEGLISGTGFCPLMCYGDRSYSVRRL